MNICDIYADIASAYVHVTLNLFCSLIPLHTNTSPDLWTRNLMSSSSWRLSFYKIFISFFCISCTCQLMYAALQFLKLFHMSLEKSTWVVNKHYILSLFFEHFSYFLGGNETLISLRTLLFL